MKFLLIGLPTLIFFLHLLIADCVAQSQPDAKPGSDDNQTLTSLMARPTPTPRPFSDIPAETPPTDSKRSITESKPATSPMSKNVDAATYKTVANGSVPPIAEGFRWRSATKQSLMFLAIQHGYALTQPKTQSAIKGRFVRDYLNSVKSLNGWDDGGRFFTNYIAHPMQGAFVGYIQIQNDPKGMKQQFGASGDYWRSRMKAMAWSAAWSTQFEIGPISQASIGNVGLKGKQTWGDIVVTPTVGTAMLISEDAIDRIVMKRIERSTDNFYVRIFARMLLNPTRTVANVFRFGKALAPRPPAGKVRDQRTEGERIDTVMLQTRTNPSRMNDALPYLAWVTALVAMGGSLVFSEVMELPPCVLCWYQRIAMYPLVVVIGVGIVLRDTRVKYYALALSGIGLLVSIYHNLLYYVLIPESIVPCAEGVSCTSRQIEWLGFITIPLMSLTAFVIVTLSLLIYRPKEK